MIWGMSFDDSFEDEVKVTIIATWFNEQASSKRKVVRTDNRWNPINRQPENFITRWINETIGWNAANQNGFSSSTIDNVNLSNDAFRAPDNSDEDWETPAFMSRQLNND
jgi:hypothetical protein